MAARLSTMLARPLARRSPALVAPRRAIRFESSASPTGGEHAPEQKDVLKKGAKRDPELYILLAVMGGAFSLAGFYFGRKPTSATSESKVHVAEGSMPWQEPESDGQKAREHFKYQYHPGGDSRNPPKDAPSALHSVIVPNVNLPKDLHERYNKWGKDDY